MSQLWNMNVLDYSEYFSGHILFDATYLTDSCTVTGEIPRVTTVAVICFHEQVKEAFLKVLLRYDGFERNNQTIIFDGYDINVIPRGLLRKNIRILPNDPIMFPMNLVDNIILGRSNISREDVIVACKNLGLMNYIVDLNMDPCVLDSKTKSKQLILSIGLARVMVEKPKVLIFDNSWLSYNAFLPKTMQKLKSQLTILLFVEGYSSYLDVDYVLDLGIPLTSIQSVNDYCQGFSRFVKESIVSIEHCSCQGVIKYLRPPRAWCNRMPTAPKTLPAPKSSIRSLFYHFIKQCRGLQISYFKFTLGTIGASVAGFLTACFVVVFSTMIEALMNSSTDTTRTVVNRWCLILLVVAFGGLIGYYFQIVFLDVNASKMGGVLRVNCIKSVFSQVSTSGLSWLESQSAQSKVSNQINMKSKLFETTISTVRYNDYTL